MSAQAQRKRRSESLNTSVFKLCPPILNRRHQTQADYKSASTFGLLARCRRLDRRFDLEQLLGILNPVGIAAALGLDESGGFGARALQGEAQDGTLDDVHVVALLAEQL